MGGFRWCIVPLMRLLVGPTCAGKTTLLTAWQEEANAQDLAINVTFAFALGADAKIPTGVQDVVHFNLLRGWTPTSTRKRVSADADPLLARLIEAADDVTVIAAPTTELIRRASQRTLVEPSELHPKLGAYKSSHWIQVLESDKLPQIYEHLALVLDQVGKPHRYLCSNSALHDDMQPISRWDFPMLGRPDAAEMCEGGGHPARQLQVRGGTYQGDYRDGGSGSARSATLSQVLQMPLAGKRVLDVGCAEGAAALSAYRMGARVTAIEPWKKRFDEARLIAESLDADIDLRNLYLEELAEPDNSYDVVMALNVIHHQPDPLAFIDQLSRLTSEYLVLEYPSLSDARFRSTFDFAGELPDDLPLFGLSTADQDQTFVFSPAGLTRYLVDTVATFTEHESFSSPKSNRWITIFSGKQDIPGKLRASEQSRLVKDGATKQIAGLERELRAMRESRSWRLTAPMRRLHDRLR